MSVESTFQNIQRILEGKSYYSEMFKIYPKDHIFAKHSIKWEPVLTSHMGKPIKSKSSKWLCAWLLEEQFLLNKGYKDDSDLISEDSINLQNFALPLVRRLIGELSKIDNISPHDQYVKQLTMTKNDIIELKLKNPYGALYPNIPVSLIPNKDLEGIIEIVFTQLTEQLQSHVNHSRFLIEPMIITLNKENPSELIIRTAIK
jgi:hypothetical protein